MISQPDDLRSRARERMRKSRTEIQAMTPEDVMALIDDLQVHQAELEITNEDLLETQQKLAKAYQSYAVLYDDAPMAYLTLDEDYVIRRVNKAAAALFARALNDLDGVNLLSLATPEDRDLCYLYLRNSKPGAAATTEIRFLREDGDTFWGRLHAIRIDAGASDCAGFRAAIMDITERKRMEEDLRQHVKQLAIANKELETFSYSLSHDLRAPLRAMKGFSGILLEDYSNDLDAEGRDYLNRIAIGAEKMNGIIDDMLCLANISRKDMSRPKIDLSALAAAVFKELRRAEPERNVKVVIAERLIARGDARLMKIALSNLLGNAWKYSGKTPDAAIEFGVMKKNDEQVYFVRDNGVGFDMVQAYKLFKPFQRLHSESQFPGTGIGLAIVNKVIQRHGGRIWGEGEAGKGATFYFTINVDPRLSFGESWTMRKPHSILLLDDKPEDVTPTPKAALRPRKKNV
jgi:PAS domain S-box-containing protein